MGFRTMAFNTLFLFFVLAVFPFCKEAKPKAAENISNTISRTTIGDTVSSIGKNIRCVFQDAKNNYWYGSNDEGLYLFNGKTLTRFTTQHGLCDNQIRTIKEDKSGNIFLGTGNGVSVFNGHSFSTLFINENNPSEWKISSDDLWFDAGYKGGVYRYDEKVLTYLQFPTTNLGDEYLLKHPGNSISPYTVYCTLKDSKGNSWFGTQNLGVCRYDGKSFTWFTEKGLSGPAVRVIFEDRNGIVWFGNNGFGLFRYDGKALSNFTEEKGLSNEDFVKTSMVSDKPSTLARVWDINEDGDGNLWIGTIDAGAWRYDGKTLTNYTAKNGLPNNSINTIYKDKNGKLRVGTGEGVYKFNGKSFERFKL